MRRQATEVELWAVKYATQHNLTLNEKTYRDLGVSAWKGKNAKEGALGAFLHAVDQGVIAKGSYLLIEGFDRLTRMPVDEALDLFLRIMKSGIVIVTMADGQVYSKDNVKENWTKLIVVLAIMARASEESDNKSRFIRANVQNRLNTGKPLGNTMPPWLTLNAARSGYVVNTKKADIVRRVFDMSLKGNGLYLICKTLNEEEVPVLRNARDGWSISGLKQMINNPYVIGTLRSKHGDYEDHYPAIIEKTVFYEVQRLMSERNRAGKGRKGTNVANLFSNLVKCGECGGAMKFSRSPTGDKGRVNEHLHCLSALEKRGCDAKRLNYAYIEKALLRKFLESDAIEVQPRSASDADPAVALRAEIADKQEQVNKLLDLIEASGTRESKNLLGRLTVREAELSELQEKLRVSQVPSPSTDVWAAAQAMMDRHDELRETPGPELYALRLQLQAALKQFIARIDLPMAVRERKRAGEIIRSRDAIVTYREHQGVALVTRDLKAKYKGTLGPHTDAAIHAVMSRPRPVSYLVPPQGGAAKKAVRLAKA